MYHNYGYTTPHVHAQIEFAGSKFNYLLTQRTEWLEDHQCVSFFEKEDASMAATVDITTLLVTQVPVTEGGGTPVTADQVSYECCLDPMPSSISI